MTTQLPASTVKNLLGRADYQSRFREVLGQRAPQFMASIANLAMDPNLRTCKPESVIAAGFVAATLDLPVDRNLAFSWVVPYDGKNGKLAQFQMGWRGIVQLAMRSGQYSRMNACAINAEAFIGRDKEVGEPLIDWDKLDPEKPTFGFVAAWRLVNGFSKIALWTVAQVKAHAGRYSQSFRSGRHSPWQTHFEEMALKTVLANELRKWGILSVEMRTALKQDQAAQLDVEGAPIYLDNETEEPEPRRPIFRSVEKTPQDAPTPEGDGDIAPEPPKPQEEAKAAEEPPKRGRGRPRKPAPEPEPKPEPVSQNETPEPQTEDEITSEIADLAKLKRAMEVAGVRDWDTFAAHCQQLDLITSAKGLRGVEHLTGDELKGILRNFAGIVRKMEMEGGAK